MINLIATRKGAIINMTGGAYKVFPSINKAKKESWKIQKSNGGLGHGAVQLL